MDSKFLLETLAALGVGAGTLAYLVKALLKIYLDRDIERYKADLRAAHDTALERLRTDLRIQAFERETTFSRLHDKRVEVIEQLYRRIVAVSRAMNELTSPIQMSGGPSLAERSKEAGSAANAFLDYYLENQIYFDETLCNQLQAFNEKLRLAWIDYHLYGSEEEGVARACSDSRFKAYQTINEGLPEIRREIERVFRQMLGHTHIEDRKDT